MITYGTNPGMGMGITQHIPATEGDGRHFEYEGTLDGAKRKASKLATPPVAIQLLAEQRLVATRRPYFGWDGKVGWHPWELLERAF